MKLQATDIGASEQTLTAVFPCGFQCSPAACYEATETHVDAIEQTLTAVFS